MTDQETSLLNFRIPNELKHEFHLLCAENHTRMTTEMIRMIKEFVKRESIEQDAYKLAKQVSEKKSRSEVQGGSVKCPYTGVWSEPILRG